MNYTIQMMYDNNAILAMAKAVRKTMRAKFDGRKKYLIAAVVVMGLAVLIKDIVTKSIGVITLTAVVCAAALVAYILSEDKITARRSRKNGNEYGFALRVDFGEEFYTSTTEMAQIDWKYSDIAALAKTGNYIVFVLGESQAQAFDMNGLKEGTAEQLIAFLEEKTGKKVQEI